MFSAIYYQPVYLIVITFLTIFAILGRRDNHSEIYRLRSNNNVLFLLIYVVGFALFIGFRPISSVFVDMTQYQGLYDRMAGVPFYFSYDTENIIYDNLMYYLVSKQVDPRLFYILISFIYFGGIGICCYKLFPNNLILSFVVYLAGFSTFSYGTNGIKAGAAASLFLVAIAYRDKLRISIPVALLSYGFHHSMSMVIVACFCVLLIENPKYYLYGWIVSLIIAALHITYFQILFARFTDEHGAEYLRATDVDSYITGFRPDFILYSAVPIVVGNYIINKYVYGSKTYIFLLNLYTMTNSLWMLCMYASFSNRIAYLSWFMYPIVLLYPFVSYNTNQRHGKYLRWVVYGHLGFTLFMTFVYYA